MEGNDFRPLLLLVALLGVLWTVASGYLFLAAMIQGAPATGFLWMATGMLTLGIAALAIARCGSLR